MPGITEQATERAEFTITNLRIDDAAKLFDFYRSLPESVTELFRPFTDLSTDLFIEHLEQTAAGKHISIGIVDDDSKIQGHAFVLFCDTDKPVFGIGLAESQHGRGCGRKLAEAILSASCAKGLPLVTLTVLKFNERAIKLYESLGFVMAGEDTYKTKNDSYFMEWRPLVGKT